MKVTKMLMKGALFTSLVIFSSNVFAVEPTTYPTNKQAAKMTRLGTGEAGVLVEPPFTNKIAPNKKNKKKNPRAIIPDNGGAASIKSSEKGSKTVKQRKRKNPRTINPDDGAGKTSSTKTSGKGSKTLIRKGQKEAGVLVEPTGLE